LNSKLGASDADNIGELLGSKSEQEQKKLQSKGETTAESVSNEPPTKRRATEPAVTLPGIGAGPAKVGELTIIPTPSPYSKEE
jgi:hypothetical protein